MRRSTVTEEQLVAVFDRRAESFKQEMKEYPQGHSRWLAARACLGTTLILRDELLTVLRAADHGEVLTFPDAEKSGEFSRGVHATINGIIEEMKAEGFGPEVSTATFVALCKKLGVAAVEKTR